MAEILYGFDPLCGWCYGIVPAIRRVARDHPGLPIRVVMAGLVSGERIGPYRAMEGYIRSASERLRAVTGRAPSGAFFDLIRRDDVRGDSGPPCIAIAHVAGHAPDRAVEFAHAVIEAHFEQGADLNRPETYAPLLKAAGVEAPLPALDDRALAESVWEAGRRIGIRSFPTLAVVRNGRARVLPAEYDPARLSALVGQATA
ncbi:DsbA family protein [Rubellimicrobium sp. CFH 75288]|uniref:DsbA family protein n=1 Tax=Rubellimicrobium sp. CFH 75288 TaxID=2697034 RepID=UPI0014127135|nr:DsbA family protein [Rubellimicrobium sp. CFH 75288]NAZ36000.1 hypothetical protein [Rubellimicrobium sp. CFH 75288]